MSSKNRNKAKNHPDAKSTSETDSLSFDGIGQSSEESEAVESTKRKGGIRVFLIAMLSFVMLWVSFPPVGNWFPEFGLWWLAWIAPAPLIWLVFAEKLPGRRPYWQLYFAGMIYWLATFYFIPIPHSALWLAWFVLCVYLAVYIPALVGISRTMVQTLKLPAVICVPVVWTGLEWIRGHFATGHSFACLSHTQYEQPLLIKTADIFGAYTITFAIVWVSIGFATLSWSIGKSLLGPDSGTNTHSTWDRFVRTVTAFLMLAAVALYGKARLGEPIQYKSEAVAKLGLIQTSDDVLFKPLTDEQIDQMISDKRRLTLEAREQWNDLDLIIWPESAFVPFADLLSDVNQETTVEATGNANTKFWSHATGFPSEFATPVPLLTGGQTQDPAKDTIFNAAFVVGTDGKVSDRYFKRHLVMVGEYVPLGEEIPWLEEMSPSKSINAGEEFKSIAINGVNLAPNICFESTVPHFMLNQVNSLSKNGAEPDVLINLTNDGWFFGTSCLDLHLACNVMRAVELRKPHVVVSNTGFSANIDTCGRILEQGPRRAEAVLRAEIRPIERASFYRQTGEVVPMAFGYISLAMLLIGFVHRLWTRGRDTPAG